MRDWWQVLELWSKQRVAVIYSLPPGVMERLYYILSRLNFSLTFAQCPISGIFLRWFTQVFSTLILCFCKYFSSDLKKNDFLAIYRIPGSHRYLQRSKWTGILKCSKYFETTFWSGSCLLCHQSINVEHKEKEWAKHTFTRRTLTKIWG